MALKLSSEEPVFHRRRKMPPGDEAICREKIKELLEAGLIRRSESEYATPTVVAARKDLTGEVLSRRMCGDYRDLNKITVPDRYPMPMAEELFDKMADGVYFTTLDLRQGFNQIKISEEDVKKTAFHGPDGLYEWLYMPFGLRNASAVFQRVMDAVLRGIEHAACYIDDVVIFSLTEQQHLEDVERTLTAIEEAGLTCHPNKCRWGEQTVQYLGYEVTGGQIGIQQAKVQVLDKLREPRDKSGLRAVLGFLSYYRRFVPNFSKRAGAERDAARGHGVGVGREAEGGAARSHVSSEDGDSAAAASSRPALHPLHRLEQPGDGGDPGREFTLVTDHQPLTWLMTTPGLTGRNARWAVKLQEYDFKIRHRPGKTLQHVDGLSRNPPPPEAEQAAKQMGETEQEPAQTLILLAREVERAGAKGSKGPADIWLDAKAMEWLKGETEEDETVPERVRARGHHYRWYQQQLQIKTEDGWKPVPAPEERDAVIKEVHNKLGHFGHERTVQLLKTGWWWEGMRRQVKEWVEGPRELPLSRSGNQYIVFMVEHVSKWLEVRAIPSKSARHIAAAFKAQVVCRFGACREVLTDQGTEFQGEFKKLLAESGIAHRKTSRYHPQSDGLTERAVQTFKRGLRAYGEQRKRDWDEELDWIAAGYRFGKQTALKDHSPYSLLYGREPILPVGAPRVLTDTVTAGTIKNWVALSEVRARYMRYMMPAALENLHTAQLRDARRYEQRQRKGDGRVTRGVSEGQEVYLKRAKQDTLDVGLGTVRWKVKEVRPSGVLVLENDTGAQLKEHQTNTAVIRGIGPQRNGPVTRAQAARARAQEGAEGG
ncbi:unnamed protein product [Closterium sp. Yama58-4]|nr:unnamed protein product [Closterium sp. Yama58-4]